MQELIEFVTFETKFNRHFGSCLVWFTSALGNRNSHSDQSILVDCTLLHANDTLMS